VANIDTLEHAPTASIKVLLSDLLANDSDADGDSLNVTVASTSANGVTVNVSGGWVYYLPSPSFTDADSFTYTITGKPNPQRRLSSAHSLALEKPGSMARFRKMTGRAASQTLQGRPSPRR